MAALKASAAPPSAAAAMMMVALCIALLAGTAHAACANPLGSPSAYRLGEGPAAHLKRLRATSSKWQDLNAVDFLAPAGTPVVAAADGVVCDPSKNAACVFGKTEQEKRDPKSLQSFYVSGADGRVYYYTHVRDILVKPGQRVVAGVTPVATVGAYDGKNAHLHLAVSFGSACDLLKCAPADARGCS